jgi:hypothetical protein
MVLIAGVYDIPLRALMPDYTVAPPTVSKPRSWRSPTAGCLPLSDPLRIASPAVRRYARQVDRGVAVLRGRWRWLGISLALLRGEGDRCIRR